MKEVSYHPMRFEDLDEVYKLEYQLFPNPWPRSFFENDLQRFNTIALVARDTTKPVGYVIGNCIDLELHITNIGVAPDYQRQGIAQHLMKEVEEIARNRGCIYAYLEVRVNNLPAINLYKKIGYRILYLRKNYYLDGTDAYVMGKELQKEVL
uniref:[Ribosomal protein bS18]-alanine N-acetyltransferase n=1 Tax=candidate division WOR-3 bacterium TaxID=2052148 RepID=A0A7C4TAJ7_UNCW3